MLKRVRWNGFTSGFVSGLFLLLTGGLLFLIKNPWEMKRESLKDLSFFGRDNRIREQAFWGKCGFQLKTRR